MWLVKMHVQVVERVHMLVMMHAYMHAYTWQICMILAMSVLHMP
jgi:hypothetical protein